MFYDSDIDRDLDPHFAEDNPALVSFPNSIELGCIAFFLAFPGAGN
jgi:hypothetical protein